MCIETGRKRVHTHDKYFVRGSAGFCNTEKQTPSPQPSPCPFSFPAETVSFVGFAILKNKHLALSLLLAHFHFRLKQCLLCLVSLGIP